MPALVSFNLPATSNDVQQASETAQAHKEHDPQGVYPLCCRSKISTQMPSVTFEINNASAASKDSIVDQHDPQGIYPLCCRYHTVNNSSRKSQQSLRTVYESDLNSATEKA
ncbi:hypothetical protein BDR26DRAFT_1008797 [Obelidium mucronatum]|nr:hypothetical protein BDR26DRAFT_1008797 [Obelidium mucronatum]